MAEVTVSQLAEVVGAPVDRLLGQMKQAGLTHTQAEQIVSDDDKQTLLAFLKSSHGETVDAPKKITLKRKTLSTLKTSSSQGKKTVSVEVRKKRTYVKRDPQELLAEEQAKNAGSEKSEQELAAEKAAAEEAAAKAAAEAKAEAEKAAAAAKAAAPAEEILDKSKMDPEVLRQMAAAKRQEKEAKDRELQAAALAAKRAEEERQQAGAETAKKSEEKKAKPTRLHAEPDADKDERVSKKKGGPKAKELAVKKRGKNRGHNIRDIDMDGEGNMRGRRKQKILKLPEGAKQHGFSAPTEKKTIEVAIPEAILVSELAQKMHVKASEVIKKLMGMGVMATINQSLDQDTAQLVVEELGHIAKLVSGDEVEEALEIELGQQEGTMAPRAPVVTVMGHVDHGKTSLLDYIRKTGVAGGEAGGITQHIGAYHVETDHGMISFLDTPGHAAFTAMRARGAKSTDIVILVVAADDGVMPQTEEAIKHARAAEVPIIVAVNKIDKEAADLDRVKNELAAKDVIPEDWGGDVQFVPVSAHTGEGVDALLEAILLQAELLELQAATDIPGSGIVIESRLDKGRGSVASVLVQAGTLRQGDIVLAGHHYGRVRAMNDENGQPIKEAGPSIPVEILGLDGTPDAGDSFMVLENEKKAREVTLFRQAKDREDKLKRQQAAKLENMFANMGSDEVRTLNIVIKADVRGSLEAIQASLLDLGNEEVKVNIITGGVGGITETDVTLALTSNAVVFGFNVRADNKARQVVENEGIDLRYYSIIYDLIDDVKQALSGMLSPEMREEINGTAEVRDVFTSPKFGQIAGCMVIEGTLIRSNPIRVLRDDVVIYEGELESLRRFKDDVNEVRNGMECGIGVKNYTDVKPGDKIEVYEVKEYARTL
ncbi:translation initiation factor IF-2 [Dasania sp. GY-MA-18]|uniref:Translation initiation factor IF-2 n=1 Tax=Dasania phycosphaerae TaxID=2950436 RepID=A0A9J6RHI3_9GAMM|nr:MULTISPECIES: translation initiation factor IF-2 [Dasania]MCR8921235.1 translation initiation factor IF-2 [Dasania sp. GY-MA-18]MCZ0863663.1 translation initiation factor IF-2 [Dasania phycosphaerae]MCZ0867391.1 translation initiation factor IF-2 [Dasania phycosphaerae]